MSATTIFLLLLAQQPELLYSATRYTMREERAPRIRLRISATPGDTWTLTPEGAKWRYGASPTQTWSKQP